MKDIHQWFAEYSDSHQNDLNEKIHWLCVPAIMFAILGILWILTPLILALVIAAILVFYLRLSPQLTYGMAIVVSGMFILALILRPILLPLCITVFVLAWIGQFYGHHVEGKKPTFFKDLQFLLIGPLWVLSFVFKKLGIKY
ncbi:Uncharacterised protein [BD1-7 clade bacterium]|uniref:DUF962 domain-containing protein n=1 Tax=BD1-7 clade bacterium TaxID=2029982 RepID=A0A5S9MQY6_9GAMM|nr:Uncharacterised protein [BD1-7 clade bacterium]